MESPGEYRGNERFEIVRRIGAGGMGIVYEALDRERRMRVALKTLPQIQPSALYLFKNEFRALVGVTHPNLVTLYELLNEDDRWFFTMQYVEGCDFLSYVARRQLQPDGETMTLASQPEGALKHPARRPASCDYERLRQALAQVVMGLSALHADGKVHRDIKPSNILVTAEGRAVILDFGLVQNFSQDNVRATSAFAGSAAYMSPEQAAGELLTEMTDWYSVGVVLYEALTGDFPHTGSMLELLNRKRNEKPRPPMSIVPQTPLELNDLCVALLDADPACRPHAKDILRILVASKRTPVAQEQPERRLFVGRARETAVLHRAFERMRDGAAVVVSIDGASGVGKSALLRECIEQFRKLGAAVMVGRCYEQESVPYKAFDNLIDGLTSYLHRLPESDTAALMPRDAGMLADVFPVMGRLPAVSSARIRTTAALDPHEIRRRAFQAVRELLSRLGDRVPLVLVIDDLQWGDRDSANLIAETLRQPDGPALLLIVAYRGEYVERSVALRALLSAVESQLVARFRIDLAPLDGEETHELADRLLMGTGIGSRTLLDTIVRESQGNAYFIRELIQNAKEDRVTGAVNLESVIMGRVAALPPEPFALLEAIAVAARPIPQSIAYAAAGIREIDPAGMALLRSMRMVRTSGNGLADDVETYHDRIRETVAGRLGEAKLRAQHRALAQAFEDSQSVEPESLAIHLELGGEPERALHYFRRAAENASNALAFDKAANLYTRALALVPGGYPGRVALLESLADAQANAGFSLLAAETYRDLFGMRGMEHRTDLARKAAYQFCICGHAQEGKAAFQIVLRKAGLRMPGQPWIAVAGRLAMLTWLRVRGLRFRSRAPDNIQASKLEAIDVCMFVSLGLSTVNPYAGTYFSALAVALALQAGESGRAAKALAWEAVVTAAFSGGRQRAEALLSRAEEIYRDHQAPVNHVFIDMARGMVVYESGQVAEGLPLLEAAENVLAECSGVNFELNATRTYQLWSMVHLGWCNKLAATAPLWFRDALNRGDAYTAANVGSQPYVLALLGQDDPERASAIHDQSMSLWPVQEYTLQKMMAALGRGWIDLYIDDAEASWRAANDHWKRARRVFLHLLENIPAYMLHWRALSALAMAEHTRKAGRDPQEFIRAAERDAASLRRLTLSHGLAMGEAVLAGVAALRSDRAKAIAHLKVATQGFDRAAMMTLAATSRRELGRLMGNEEGVHTMRSAEEQLASLGVRNVDGITRVFLRGTRAL